MKKRIMALLLSGILSVSLLAGCQKGEEQKLEPGDVAEQTEPESEDESEDESETGEEDEPYANMVNPWREIDEDEAKEACVRLFKVPDGAELLGWTILDDATEALGVSQPLVECSFEIDDLIFNLFTFCFSIDFCFSKDFV